MFPVVGIHKLMFVQKPSQTHNLPKVASFPFPEYNKRKHAKWQSSFVEKVSSNLFQHYFLPLILKKFFLFTFDEILFSSVWIISSSISNKDADCRT
jgi:uncharacterized membrane protein